MEENFSIEFVPGDEYNQQVPDALSRLVEDSRTPSQKLQALKESKSLDELNLIMNNKAIHIPNHIYKTIQMYHNTERGHFAAERVFSRMDKDKAIHFEKPKKWIKAFIKQCVCCQLLDRLKLRIKTRPFTTSSLSPFEMVCLDHIGPIQVDNKDLYILVIIDCFSRWIELFVTESTSAIDTAKCLFNYYGRYGSAETISSDRGTAFNNEIIQQLVEMGGSEY